MTRNEQLQFDSYVADKSGLSITVVRAWRDAENGPAGNPLNIGPGRNYGSALNAAKATVNLLRKPLYRGVLGAAKHGSDTAQLKAIAASPWDANHYRGAGGSPGSLLFGTYKRETSGKGGIAGAEGAVASAVASPVKAVTGVLGGVENVGVKLLAYLVLSGVAVGLFVIGASRATGIVPGEFSAMRADQRGAVPF